MPDYQWSPITDLDDHWFSVHDTELPAIRQVWEDWKLEMTPAEIDHAMARVCREQAIETGQIEGLYDLDMGTTEVLIEHGIEASLINHASPERVEALIRDQLEALEGVFAFVKGERRLSVSYLNELHQQLTQHQTDYPSGQERGRFKTRPNSVKKRDGFRHEYCPPEHVDSEMEQLLKWHEEHVEKGVAPEVEAAWLHHRFTQIHPYADGNGRVARLLASIILIRASSFPILARRSEKLRYLEALESADSGSLEALVEYFRFQQRRALLSIGGNLTDRRRYPRVATTTVREAMAAAFVSMSIESSVHSGEWLAPFTKAMAKGIESIKELSALLVQASEDPSHPYLNARIEMGETLEIPTMHPEILKELDYVPSRTGYAHTLWLKIEGNRKCRLVLTFHQPTSIFNGLVTALVYLEDATEDKLMDRSLSEPFLFLYPEESEGLVARFAKWSTASLTRAFARWIIDR